MAGCNLYDEDDDVIRTLRCEKCGDEMGTYSQEADDNASEEEVEAAYERDPHWDLCGECRKGFPAERKQA